MQKVKLLTIMVMTSLLLTSCNSKSVEDTYNKSTDIIIIDEEDITYDTVIQNGIKYKVNTTVFREKLTSDVSRGSLYTSDFSTLYVYVAEGKSDFLYSAIADKFNVSDENIEVSDFTDKEDRKWICKNHFISEKNVIVVTYINEINNKTVYVEYTLLSTKGIYEKDVVEELLSTIEMEAE